MLHILTKGRNPISTCTHFIWTCRCKTKAKGSKRPLSLRTNRQIFSNLFMKLRITYYDGKILLFITIPVLINFRGLKSFEII